MVSLTSGQRRRARGLAEVGVKLRDAEAMVDIWDALPPGQRWALLTEREREALRSEDPTMVEILDRQAARYRA